MKPSFVFTFIYFYALLSSGFTSKEDERAELDAILQLIEMDFGEFCQKIADATWGELVNGKKKDLSNKLERDKAFGIFSQAQANETHTHYTPRVLHTDRDILRRKARLLMRPADHMLPPESWIRLITFADTAFHKIRYSKNYDCGMNATCSYKDLQSRLSRERDEETLAKIKKSWEKHLPDVNEYRENVLPLLKMAAIASNYTTVEEYWSMLVEYSHDNMMIKARQLWEQVRPLYLKLHKYVALRVRGAAGVGQPLPSYLLRSFTGDDWSNLIEILLPKHPDIYQKIHENLQRKELGGLNALRQASRLLSDLRLDELPPEVLEESTFNSTCPPLLVDWCLPNNKNKMRVVSCNDVGIQHYLDAHEVAMRIKHKQIASLHSNNTHILREASRYSAVYEAIPGFASLLALNPHALKRAGLFPIDKFAFNANYHRVVLQLITALRDLPRLNFYLAADEWRMSYLMASPSKPAPSWSEFRRKFSLLEVSDVDILGDPDVLYNKPLMGKFMGIILKYQIYQGYAEELASDEESDLIEHVADNNDRIYDAMMQGYSVPWPELVGSLLATREQDLEHTALTDYYTLLDDYLDHQLDPAPDNDEGIFYQEPPTTTKEPEPAENEIPDEPIPEHKEEINDIVANYEEDPSKGTETSTVGVLEIKKPVTTGDQERQDTKAASYNTYWWIGIVVAIVIVVVFMAIIARKRQNHRKELERQRRQNNHA